MRQAGRGFRTWLAVAIAAGLVMTYMLATTFAGSATGATTATTTQVLSIPGAAFTAGDNGCTYTHGNYMGRIVDTNGCYYVASMQLPNGATVTSVRAEYDSTNGSASLHFEESDSHSNHTDMANISMSNGCTPGPSSCHVNDTTINSPDVTNDSRSYGVWLNPSGSGFILYRVIVTLSVTTTSAAVSSGPSTPIPASQSHQND